MSQIVARALVFISSAAVLMLEILAGRLMAPYVGVSIETFTGIIGTVLAAIALGAWVGGQMADRGDPALLLGPAFTLGGILALLAPTITAAFGEAVRGGGAVAIVVLTVVAFFAPAAVLSAVTPIVVKLRLRSLSRTGEVVGSLSAVGTAGALVGTFLTGFVLLATLPTRPIVLAIGVLLVAIGIALSLRFRRDGKPSSKDISSTAAGAGLAALLLVVVNGPCQWETTYSCANIVADEANPSGRTLRLDLLAHSYVDIDDPLNLHFRYIRDYVSAIDATAAEGPLNTLALGGGGFTMPRFLAADRPGSTTVVFEIDDALVDIAITELALDPDEINLTVHADDARVGLTRLIEDAGNRPAGPPFDVVIGDAFGGLSVPWHLTTTEFLTELKSVMTADGVYVMNAIDYPDFDFVRAEITTLQELFANVVVVTLDDYVEGRRGGNFVIVATDTTIDIAAIEANLAEWESESLVVAGDRLDDFVGQSQTLTDDFAPVDQMIDTP